MIEEIEKKLEELKEKYKEKVKTFKEHKSLKKLKQKIENYFLSKNENVYLNNILFLIRYSMKYKNVCTWPSYNDLLILNINLNDNFKKLMKQNGNFFERFKKNLTECNDNTTEAEGTEKKNENINNSDNDSNNTISKQNNKASSEQKEADTHINMYFNEDVTLFNKIKLNIFMYFVLNNYRMKILIESLSALRKPINIVYINCPNNKQRKMTILEKVSKLISPKYELSNVTINRKDNEEIKTHVKRETGSEMKKKCVSCSSDSKSYFDIPTDDGMQKGKNNYTAGYNPINNTIWICANNVNNVYKLKYILLHELIHAFDFARANIDMYNCHHVACTEIRAYNMSNQCGYFNSKCFKGTVNVFEYLKGDDIQTTEKNKCIYNNTYSSLYQFKPCQNNTHKYINDIFQKCVNDYWPFMCAPERDSKYKPSRIIRKYE